MESCARQPVADQGSLAKCCRARSKLAETLYFRDHSIRAKAKMVLDYKGISYEAVERCYSLDRNEDLRCINQRAEVPTLVLDDGRVMRTPPSFANILRMHFRIRHSFHVIHMSAHGCAELKTSATEALMP